MYEDDINVHIKSFHISQFPLCNLLTLSMIRIMFLHQNLIISPIDNLIVFANIIRLNLEDKTIDKI